MRRTPVVAAAISVLVLASAACSGAETAPVETAPVETAAAESTTSATQPADPSQPAATPSTDTTRPSEATTDTASPPATTEPVPGDDSHAVLEGRWEGTTAVPGLGELPFSVELASTGGTLSGTMDVQGNFGLPLTAVSFDGSTLHFELQSPLGLATWEGELREGRIEGEFAQLGSTSTFVLHRPDDAPAAPETSTAYRAEMVTFSSGAYDLAGELALPLTSGPHPAVILINGSGDQDRNAVVADFPIFGELADHLAQAGIASLRWDDRGVGGSGGDGLLTTLQARADDVVAALALLRAHPEIRSDRIGLVGFSEGGLIAPMAANRADDIAFVALLASPAVPGDELLRAQLVRILTVSGATDEVIEQERALQELVLGAIDSDEGWDEVEDGYRDWARRQLEELTDEARESIPDEEIFVEVMTASELASVRSPWFVSYVTYDPRGDLIELDVPVLALFGELDTQVPPAANAAALSEAIAASSIPSYAIGTVLGANHLFQQAVTGSPDEYAELTPEFAPEFLQLLGDWLTEQVNR